MVQAKKPLVEGKKDIYLTPVLGYGHIVLRTDERDALDGTDAHAAQVHRATDIEARNGIREERLDEKFVLVTAETAQPDECRQDQCDADDDENADSRVVGLVVASHENLLV